MAGPFAPLPLQESQHYYEPVRQRIPHRYSAPRDFCRQALSLSPPAAYRHERQPADARIGTRLPTFRAAAAEQARATSVPDTAWPVNGTPARLIPGSHWSPRF